MLNSDCSPKAEVQSNLEYRLESSTKVVILQIRSSGSLVKKTVGQMNGALPGNSHNVFPSGTTKIFPKVP